MNNPFTSTFTTGKVPIYFIACAATIRALFFRTSVCNAPFAITGRAGKPGMRMNAGALTKGASNHRVIHFNLSCPCAYLTGG
jgi:hypothetical protein